MGTVLIYGAALVHKVIRQRHDAQPAPITYLPSYVGPYEVRALYRLPRACAQGRWALGTPQEQLRGALACAGKMAATDTSGGMPQGVAILLVQGPSQLVHQQ